MSSPLMTAEQFAARKYELPEAGRWSELEAGMIVSLGPPEDVQGTAVLNLSKSLAVHLQQADADTSGYACYEIGLIVARNPDTVRCPAISFFTDHDRFAESDNPVTDRIPQLVIEIASTHRRSSGIRTRIEEFHQAGIEWVWVVDPIEQTVRVCVKGRSAQTYSAGQTLPGGTVLPGLQIPVKDIFREPVWWSGPPLRRR